MRTLAIMAALLFVPIAAAQDKPERVKHQVTGLFMPGREADLREVFEELPEIKLVSVDFENAEAVFEYVPAKAFPGAKPDQVVKRFDEKLRQASRSTFGVKPLRTLPMDKLEKVEIAVVGLDCKACSLAAYEIVAKLEGVERATASFKDGRVTALIDPTKIKRAALEDALKKRGERLK